MTTLLPVLRRALALVILLVLLLVVWSVLIEPLIAMVIDRQTEITALSDRLVNLQAAIARIPELERRQAALKERLQAEGGIWTGASEAAVASIMQDRLRQVVSSGDGAIRSTSQMRGADEGQLQTVRVNFSIDGTLDTVARTLASIESAQPVMFVDAMTIAAPATIGPDKPPQLGLNIEVIGYMRKAEP